MALPALITSDKQNFSFEERLVLEGINGSPQFGNALFRGAVTGTGTNQLVVISTWGIPPTRFFTKIKLAFTSDVDLTIQIQFDSTLNDGKIQYWVENIKAGVTTRMDFPSIVMRGNSRISTYTYNQPTTPVANVTATISYIDMTDDLNYRAAKNILVIGDSIAYNGAVGSFQSYKATDCWDWKLRNFYKYDKGIDVCAVILATHGITTTGLDYQREETKFDSRKWDLIVYCAGTNDSVEGETEPNIVTRVNVCTTNYNNFINWKQKTQPQAKLLMCGAYPILSVSREAQLVRFRNAMQTLVIAAADSKITYVNLGNSFTATDSTKYNVDGVHPNIVGNANIYTYINTYLPTTI